MKAKIELRDHEWAVLVAVSSVGRDGWPVTVREVARYAEISPTPAYVALKSLEERGFIEGNPRFRGGWKITDRGHWITET